MVVGSFWIDFNVKLSQKWFKSGFERQRLQKNGLKLPNQSLILGHISSILELTQNIKMPDIDAKYTELKQITYITHSDNTFEVVK